ncbi:MAG: hypothetical protein LLG42_13440 [Chloroflexi bacterium]|nr:hypothetical protein [Chloroflexota bacterium]
MAKIFVRNRRHVRKGTGKPRLTVVAVADLDLQIFTRRIRKKELDALAEAVGAEIVYLPVRDSKEEDKSSE